MRIDLLFIQLAVVFLPGLIWTQLAATYAMKERPRPTEFLVRAFFFLWSSGAALVFSLVWIYGSTRRWMTRFLNWVGAATTHGKEDIWDLTFSRLQAEV